MKIEAKTLKLYAVTDRRWLKQKEKLTDVIDEMLKAGVTCVQLREKKINKELLLQEAKDLQKLCVSYGVPLIINDYPDIAKMVGAAGVHVGQNDIDIKSIRECFGTDLIVGVTAHNVKEAQEAEKAGADYIGCGAVFGSSTKGNIIELSKRELQSICQVVKIPVVAIGGITLQNAPQLVGTGIAGIAVISALFSAVDKGKAVKEFLNQQQHLNSSTLQL